jgi:uncharacterized membrane protein YidH (DUF202 family)
MRQPQTAARRLLRWYPPAWRARYGDEFAELLIAELSDRPRSLVRTLDVVRGGLVARIGAAGLGDGPAIAPGDQLRASIAALGCCLAVFLAFGVGLWSQLAIGWQWAAPDTQVVAVAMQVMSAALLVLTGLAAAAAAPIAWSAAGSLARRELRLPLSASVLGAAILVLGSRHFAHGWPGTGGRPWSGQGLVPGGPASFAWASTLSITSYWAHPGKLGAFPAAEVAWMAIAPLAALTTAAGAVKVVRRLRLSPAILRFEAAVGSAATVAMLAFLGGAACSVREGDAGPRHLFASGAIGAIDVTLMAAALLVALPLARRARELAHA